MPEQNQILTMVGVTKKFGDLIALNQVDVTLNSGEVHAVIGENGAGKSTLMRVLAGHRRADAGSMVLLGHATDILKAVPGQRNIVGFVEQEGGLVPELTGAENLIVAEGNSFWCNRASAGARLNELGKKFGAAIDPHVPVSALPMGQRQRLEILIILARGAQILILDEPTAALSIDDAKALGDIIRTFVGTGGAVFYISHKLNEVTEIADRITVMRRGLVVGRHVAKDTTVAKLAAEMVGSVAIPDSRRSKNQSSAEGENDLVEVALGVRGEAHYNGPPTEVCVLWGASKVSSYKSEADLKSINLTVRAGEVVGIAGVVGSGQTTLAEVLAGVVAPEAGDVKREPGPIAYVPENRHRDAVALTLSIRDNVMVHMHRRPAFAKGLWPRGAALSKQIQKTLEESRVQGASSDLAVSGLSGGNQQKLVLGRELEQNPVLLVAHNPFRGLDVRAIQDVRDAINGACRSGCGVVMISSDLDELFQLAHRIVVMFDGRVVGEVDLEKDDTETLGKLMGGVSRDFVH
ncbi:MAG: ATP-binding cassette domain-containing protein [Afipia felis]|nr:ATP-binding cassette domain-containing protein [Afipia felis]